MALENTQSSLENFENTLGDRNAHICTLRSSLYKVVKNFNQTEVDGIISGTYCHPLLISSVGSI